MSSIVLTILGILHLVKPGELALRNTSDQRGSWALNESNIWNDIANLSTSTNPLAPAQFSCADKQDGLYIDPTAHTRYHKCSGGLHELHTCKDHLHYSHESQSCVQSVCDAQENGLYANYSSDCREYYRCENQTLAESFICGPDNTFSAAERLCLPSGEVVCVEPHCDDNNSGYFVLPATRCQAYYSCEHGTAIHHLCPYNTVFDVDRQLCVEGGAVCYEPLCTGRVNGLYPDTSHGCRRTFECLGGSIRAVFPCPDGQLHDGRSCSPADTVSCPSVSTTTVALYSGDCAGLVEGTTWAPARDCNAYHVCKSGRVFVTMRCSRGLRYNGHKCVDQEDVPCHSYCSNHTDGPHVDLNSRCHEYFFCERGKC